MDKEKLKVFFRSKENSLFFFLMIFTVFIRIYYFFKLGAQPVWWDEGDYLAISKVWALGMETPEWWSHFTGMRPLLLPAIWAVFFKLGLGEISIRFFTLLIPSIIAVYLVFELGKEAYNKKIGLMAGLMMSVYWVFLFYSFRLLTDILATALGLASFYFFWKYFKYDKNKFLYWAIVFGVLAFYTRFPLALVLISCTIFLFSVEKLNFFRKKEIYSGLGILILLLSPYLIYFILTKFALFHFYFGESAVSVKNPIAWNILPLLFSFLHEAWALSFAIGLLSLFSLIIGFDIFWKQKNKDLNADFFILLWLLVHLTFYVIIFRAANDRWLLMLMPAIFIISSKGIIMTYNFIKTYSKWIAIFVLVILLFGGAYQNLSHGMDLIEEKKQTYLELKSAGEWLRENTPENSKVITASIVQNQYYSERQSYDFFTDDSIWKECQDLYGQLSTDEICQKKTEEAFNKKVEVVNPEYMVISIFEPVFTPQWVYSYPERYNMTPIAAFPDGTQPNLIIYKF